MTTYTAMLRSLSAEQLQTILSASGRKAREGYFARHNVRAPKAVATAARQGDKNEQRARSLHAVLQAVEDEPLAEELLRQWFLLHRSLLARALDELGIAHEDGLTNEAELQRFADLDDAAAARLIATLEQSQVAGSTHAAIYVHYMQAQMRAADS